MTDLYKDVTARHLLLVFDNTYEAYQVLVKLAQEAESVSDLSACINDYYIALVSKQINKLPPNDMGTVLIKEMCFSMSYSVFDIVADRFWETRDGEGALT